MRLEMRDVRGVFALIPTTAVANAADLRVTNTVDVAEAVRAASVLAECGVSAIMGTGTSGECSTLTSQEHVAFARAVVEGADGRCPVILGPTMGGTKATIERAELLAEAGVSGFLLGRPMWNALKSEEIVEYYGSVAEQLPELAIILYDNPIAFKGSISAEAYRELSEIPQVIGSKLTLEGGQAAEESNISAAVGDRMILMQLDSRWHAARKENPDSTPACWSSGVSCGPYPVVALQKALDAGDDETAATITAELLEVRQLTYPNGNVEELSRNPVGVIKSMVAAAGFMNPGPARPPHHAIPDDHAAAGRRAGQRWAELHQKYANYARN